jgi:microcystin-dependent protein
MFAGNFAPRGWALCDGQLLAVSQNDALFSLLGTIYGGDGRTTFGLPDVRGRIPIHQGQGPGLSPRNLGSKGGAEKVTLTPTTLPSHTHAWDVANANAANRSPTGNGLAQALNTDYCDDTPSFTPMASNMVANTGGSQSHDNLMPFQCINYIIALFGIYPSRQ